MGIYYFILQSLGRLIFLFSINLKDHVAFFGDIFFIFSLILKIGLFPFFFWVYKLGSCSKPLLTFFILTLQKIPIFIIIFSNFSMNLFYFFLFSFILGSLLIFFRKDYISMFISSSISSTFWVFLIFLDNLFLFLLFFLIYTFILFLFFYSFEPRNFFLNSYTELLLLTGIFIFIVGLPPLSLFFFKLNLRFFFGRSLKIFEFLLFWIFSFTSLLGYTKFLHFNFFFNRNLYLKNDFQIWKILIFYYLLIFSLFFVIWKSKLFKLLSSYLK